MGAEWQGSCDDGRMDVVTETAHVVDAAARAAKRSELLDHHGRAIDIEPLAPLLALLYARWNPIEVWLFGSRARGDASSRSDWDLFVLVPDDASDATFDPLAAWRLRKESAVRVDIVPCRAADFREDRGTHNTLAYEVATEGVRIA